MQTFSNGLVELAEHFRQITDVVGAMAPGNSIRGIAITDDTGNSGTFIVAATIDRGPDKSAVVDTYSYTLRSGLVWQSLQSVEQHTEQLLADLGIG